MKTIITISTCFLLLIAQQTMGQSFTCNYENPPVKVPIGANMEGITDYAFTNVFVDMIKQSRGFVNRLNLNDPVPTDATGWPMTDCQNIVQSFSTGTASTYNGTYSLTYTGQANIVAKWNATVTNKVYNAATNTTTADINLQLTEPVGSNYLILDFSNTRRTPSDPLNSGITNIKLIRPGYPSNTTQTFSTPFLNHIERFNMLRFMDWTNTNNSNVVTWNDRTLPTLPSQSNAQSTQNGVAWEYCIELANLTGKDMWVNIPHKADDNYVTQLATLLRDNVNPGINVYVEYSNEVWNTGFQQRHWNYNQANAEGNTSILNNDGINDPDLWHVRRIARRLKEISDIFRTVWGPGSINNRVRPVFCYQVAWPAYHLNPPLEWIEKTYGNPNNYFYAIAGAPYFHVSNDDPGLTATQVLDRLEASMNDLFALTPTHGLVFEQAAATARWYGLKFLSYEGGPDTFGPNNIQAKFDASMDARMETITETFLTKWYGYGAEGQFNWFTAGATNWNTQYGTWGLTYNINVQNTPKIRAIDDLLISPVPPLTAGFLLSTTTITQVDARQWIKDRYHVTYPYNWQTLNPYNRYLDGGTAQDYLVRVEQPGYYNLTINYNCWVNGARIRIELNDQIVQTINMPVTTTWGVENFQNSTPVTLTLSEGLNTIRVYYDFVNRALDTRYLSFTFQGQCTALPVELISFDAVLKENGTVGLHWITANEINNDYFIVEKSNDGNNFEPMKKIYSSKTSSANYSTTDEAPFVGNNYYRLKQIDNNGSFSYSDIKTVTLKPFNITIIYPVPATDQISFEFQSSENRDVTIHIIDPTGKYILTKSATVHQGVSIIQVNLPPLSQAVYLLQVYDDQGNIQSSKEFIVNN